MRPLLHTVLIAFAALTIACDGGDGGKSKDSDAELGARTGLYEVTFWSDQVDCSGGESPFPPFGIDVALEDDVFTQTPCTSATECDVVRDLWNTVAKSDGSGGFREVEDASYNQSAESCQLFYATAELTLNADGSARFEREVVTAAFQPNGTSDEECRELLTDWDRTGESNDCITWEGTLTE